MVFPTELNLTMIDTNDFERLRCIGLTPALMPAVMTAMTTVALAGAEPTLMRVTEVQREGVTLNDGGAEHDARLLPALRAALANEATGCWPNATSTRSGGCMRVCRR